MDGNLLALLISVAAVTLAEMGDKTQLLAMAFATRYKASKVLLGVFIATVLNHAMAVAVGTLITKLDGVQTAIQGIAALSFIFFGLWTIRGDQLDGEDKKATIYGAVMTVAIAFFIAEMGDKTQLTTIALAARFPHYPLGVLMGTTLGMLIADGIGIIVGVVLCKRIPERTVKLVSAAAFMIFGFVATYQVAMGDLNLGIGKTIVGLVIIAVLTFSAAYYLLKKESEKPVVEEDLTCVVKKEAQ